MKEKNAPRTFAIRPASCEEAGYFYAQTPEQDEELGAVGHLRIDFGSNGREFWTSWHPRGPRELNTESFSEELDDVVNQLRRDGPLKSLTAMRSYCAEHGGEIEGGWHQNYGYVLETAQYRYLLRCNPVPGDYQAYLNCFDLQQQEQMRQTQPIGRVSFANGECREIKTAENFLETIRVELPYRDTSGFRFEVLTDDPQIRKAVDDAVYDLCGEENPMSLEDYETEPPQETMMNM